MLIELVFRQRTHWTMAFLGGVCFLMLDFLNNILTWDTPLIIQGILGGFFIVTPLEFLFGILFNNNYQIWDYRNLPFDIMGQVCIPFSLLWCLISILGIVLADYIRYYIFGEEKPRYKII